MVEIELSDWLINVKGFQKKSARDVVSRCRRIENIFNISLTSNVKSKEDVDQLLQRLTQESSTFLAPHVKKIYAVTVLRRSLTLYAEYRNLLEEDK